MTPSVESMSSTPERLTIQTPETTRQAPASRIVDLFCASDEAVERLRPKFWQIANQAVATCVSEHSRDGMYRAALHLDWEFFGNQHTPLPPGIVIADGPDGKRIEYDTRHFNPENREAENKLTELGAGAISDQLSSELESREDELAIEMEQLLQDLPVYHLVQSFKTAIPPTSEQALSPEWRQIRESQIVEEVSREYGVDKTAITPFNLAGRALRKLRHRLDNETKKHEAKEPTDADALKRAQDYFTPLVVNELRGYKRSRFIRFADFRSRHDDEWWLKVRLSPHTDFPNDDIEELDVDDDIRNATFALLSKIDTPGSAVYGAVSKEFLEHFISRALNPRANTLTYDELVRTTIYECARTMTSCYWATGMGHGTLLDLDNLDGEVVPADQLRPYCAERAPGGLGFTTDEEILLKKRIPKGSVIQRPKDDTAHRIVQIQDCNESLPNNPVNSGDELLLMRFNLGSGQQPYIPGYQLLGRSWDGTFSFVRTQEDSYARADIPLTAEQRATLAKDYSALGLANLANQLTEKEGMTVADLVETISQLTNYVRPKTTTRSPHCNPMNFQPALRRRLWMILHSW